MPSVAIDRDVSGPGESSPCPHMRWPSRMARSKEYPMLDLIMLGIALGFFALSVGYTIACDRL